jgi:hypothetical protein
MLSTTLRTANPLRRGFAAILFVLAMPGLALAQRSGAAQEVLTNQSIISMVGAKLNRDLIVSKINTTRNTFDVSPTGLVNLQQGKVHADIMRAMITMAADAKLGAPNRKPEVLDNAAVIAMVSGKVPKAAIFAKIQNTRAEFDVTADGLVRLQQNNVPSDVIKAMIAKGSGEN